MVFSPLGTQCRITHWQHLTLLAVHVAVVCSLTTASTGDFLRVPKDLNAFYKTYGKPVTDAELTALDSSLSFNSADGRSAFSRRLTPDMVLRVKQRADSGHPDSIYFMALLKLYGEGVPKDPKGAIAYLRQGAERNHVESKSTLGLLLASGTTAVGRDDVAAAAWLRQASDDQHADSQWLLGSMYNEGRGVPQDPERARELYEMSANSGNPKAQVRLGLMFEYGRGGPQDWDKASGLYRKAAAQGEGEAHYNLGLMFAYGRGFTQDFVTAAQWMKNAAGRGYGPAQLLLGKFFFNGQGVPTDYKMALFWFQQAAEGGDPRVSHEAQRRFSELSGLMQIAERRANATLKSIAAQERGATNRVVDRRTQKRVHQSKTDL